MVFLTSTDAITNLDGGRQTFLEETQRVTKTGPESFTGRHRRE